MSRRLPLLLLSLLLFLPGALPADDFASWVGKGDAFDAQCQTDRALSCYLNGEKLQPKNADLLCRIAKQYCDSMGDTSSKEAKRTACQRALAYAERAAEIAPKHSMAQTLVAICCGRLAKFSDNRTKIAYSKRVEKHVRAALALNPNNDLACYVLGAWNLELASLSGFQRSMAKIYGGVPTGSLDEAARCLKKAMTLNPSRPSNYVELGRVYAAMGKTVEARTLLTQALAMPNPGKSDPLLKKRAETALRKL